MTSQMKNRLAKETSAYLLQHSTNPVDWYPWGQEALGRAKKENKPIFLSIGYSACHWCHVMEKESFEDSQTAEVLKNFFISIKVDREERPDIDHVYMAAVQALTHRGGWPLSVFLTPDLKPFYGGTYFPPKDQMGLPSFRKLLLGIAQAWKTRPGELSQSAEELTQALSQMNQLGTQGTSPASQVWPSPKVPVAAAASAILSKYDPEFGGIGTAPKFFHTTDWRVILRHWRNSQREEALSALKTTLGRWSQGGIYDHLGGGFHRYSTDREWLVPHFEKMLYDNALVTELFLEAYQATHHVDYARVAREVLSFVLREMTHSQGAFFSTVDADSEGVEGKFYVWDQDEIGKALSSDLAQLISKVFNAVPHGNWEGTNILHLKKPLESVAKEEQMDLGWLEHELSLAKTKLLQVRRQRVAPLTDKKIILSWNGLMIQTFSKAFQVLGDEAYLMAARNSANFVERFMSSPHAPQLFHSHPEGHANSQAFLDDYASFINGLLSLFECDFDSKWLEWAERLTKHVLKEFWDEAEKTFFYTPKTNDALIFRPKEFQDGALPSPTAMMLTALVRLAKLSGEHLFYEKAESVFASHWNFMSQAPLACGQMLIAWELFKNNSQEVVIVPGEEKESEQEIVDHLRSHFYPNLSIVVKTPQNQHLALLKNRLSQGKSPTVYVCRGQTCLAPLSDLEQLIKALNE